MAVSSISISGLRFVSCFNSNPVLGISTLSADTPDLLANSNALEELKLIVVSLCRGSTFAISVVGGLIGSGCEETITEPTNCSSGFGVSIFTIRCFTDSSGSRFSRITAVAAELVEVLS
ncbi:MAG: hypothetical protein FD167_3116 [bacterium]|nr:MAG: hypothetical protein FD167_3116 [bacterium]